MSDSERRDTSAASAEPSSDAAQDAPPDANIEAAARLPSLAWLVPIAAIVVAAMLVYQSLSLRGPMIEITFTTAEGIESEDAVMYRGVQVGTVRDVHLREDLTGIVVKVELRPDAGSLARRGSLYWIVRPQVSLERVSGLETILGPRYIEVLPAPEGSEEQFAFTGLERAPGAIRPTDTALEILVRAKRRGSLTIGSPVLYRDVTVGQVQAVALAPDASSVDLTVSIEAEHARLVCDNSRFWNASGIGVDFGIFGGLSVRAESLESVLAGGIGFATPTKPGDQVEDGYVFELAPEPEESWLKWTPRFGEE